MWVIAFEAFLPPVGKSVLSLNSPLIEIFEVWIFKTIFQSKDLLVQLSSFPSETSWTKFPSEAIKAARFILKRGQQRKTRVIIPCLFSQ